MMAFRPSRAPSLLDMLESEGPTQPEAHVPASRSCSWFGSPSPASRGAGSNWTEVTQPEDARSVAAEPTEPVEPQVERRLGSLKGEGVDCSICFGSLPSQQVCVLIRNAYGKRRSCRHYFHHACIQLLMRSTPAPHLCPLCRCTFERLEPLPDVRLDSTAWFSTVDADETGALEKTEVVDALSATLPVDPELLAKTLEGDLWSKWDTEGTGRINREAFAEPARGMLQFVLYSLPSLRREVSFGLSAGVPDLVACREGWFRYWDENSEQVLEFLQVLRGLVWTFRLDGALEDAGVMRAVLTKLWEEFGLTEVEAAAHGEGGRRVHSPARPVSLKLFCERPDGFCDALVDALQKDLGTAKFRRIRRRAHLLQQPASVLKKEIRSLKIVKLDAVEKSDIVEAILNAKEAAETADLQVEEPTIRTEESLGPTLVRVRTSKLQAMPMAELQRRLKVLGVAYGHCLERVELEDLFLQHCSGVPGNWAFGATSQLGKSEASNPVAAGLGPPRCSTKQCCAVQ